MENPNDIEYRGRSVNRLHRSRSATQKRKRYCARAMREISAQLFPRHVCGRDSRGVRRSTFSFIAASVRGTLLRKKKESGKPALNGKIRRVYAERARTILQTVRYLVLAK